MEILEGSPLVEVTTSEVKLRAPTPSIARTRDQRDELARYLTERVASGKLAKGDLPEKWAQCEAIHRNEHRDSAPARGMVSVHIPFSQPRQDMLCAQLCSVVGRAKPIMLCESGDDAASARVEELLHRMWCNGGFDRAIRDASQIATNTNTAIWRVTFELQIDGLLSEGSDQIEESTEHSEIRFAGLKIDAIHPNDFVIAPASLDGVASASVVGHRFYYRLQHIRELQDLGRYFKSDEELIGGDAHEDLSGAVAWSGASPDVFGSDPDVSLVELYELYVRLPSKPNRKGRERYYRVVLAPNQGFILEFEEWHHTRPPYFVSRLLTDTTGFWGGRSVARSLYPLQDQYNKVESLIYNGAMISAMPPIAGPRVSDEKYSQWSPGDWIEVDPGSQPYSPAISFKADVLESVKADLERIGDIVARISMNSLGAQDAKVSVSATQSAAIAQGIAIGLQEYIGEFTLEFSKMAAFSIELLKDNYGLWRPFYGADVSREDLEIVSQWDVNGKSPASSQMARLASLQQIMAVGQNPASGYDVYEIARLMLANSGIPGAEKLQRERPQGQPGLPPNAMVDGNETQQGDSGAAPQHGDMADLQGPALTPQRTMQGESLEPLAESLVRPSAIGNSDVGR